jgi:hypothetical protein
VGVNFGTAGNETCHASCHARNVAQVDFILHGGDLFHDNKPSRRIMFETMQLVCVCMIQLVCVYDPAGVCVLATPPQALPSLLKTSGTQSGNINV